MDLKKNAFSDQFPYCVSPRRKVVSGFGLGVVASLIVLVTVLSTVSPFKAPFFSPNFHNSFRVNNNSTSLVTRPSSSFATSNSSNATSITPTGELPTPVGSDLLQKIKEGEVVDIAHEGNLSAIYDNAPVLGSIGKGKSVGKTQLGNFSEKVGNGSITLEDGKVEEKAQFVNGSVLHKTNSTGVGEGGALERTHMANSSEKSEKGSSLNKQMVGFAEKSNSGKNMVNENDNKDNQRISSAENNSTVSGNGTQPAGRDHYQGSYGECDLFDGRWVRDDTKPYYAAGSCPYVDRDFDCHLNRRPDDGFVKWKWQPYACDMPSLNATDFLERLRGKKLVFVGDSLNRNMWESLVCILRGSIHKKKRVYEISGRSDFKKKGFYAFRFEDYNCSVDFVSTVFLVKESTFKGTNGSIETLRLDLMDQTTSMYHDADVLVFNTGHWWTHEKTSRGEDYYQEGNHVYPRLKVLQAYKKALATWGRWVDKNIDASRTEVIFRGYSVTHFRGGQWNSGGQCHKETEPIFSDAYLAHYPSKMRALEHVLREMKTPVIYLNISRLTDYRKDGHPSIYRREYKTVEEKIAAEQSQDCSHWCLPGVPDTWNELLYASLLQAGKGSWRG